MTVSLYNLNRFSSYRLSVAALFFFVALCAASMMTVLPWQSAAAAAAGQDATQSLSAPLSMVDKGALFLSHKHALPQNTYTDDLVVAHDDTLTGDVVILSGDVEIEEGGEIIGNLIVASGDIKIKSGGRVEGDVTNLSGDVKVQGKITGNLSVLSGDIDLDGSSVVGGDVSVLSGKVDRSEDSQIGGEVRTGPKVKIPLLGFLGEEVAEEIKGEIAKELNNAARESSRRELRTETREETSWVGQLFGFLLRLTGAAALTILIGIGAGLLARTKPEYVDSVRQRLRSEMAANFAIGFLFNIVLGFLAIIFAITLCLLPMTLVSGGLLLAVNGVGWTAIAATVGRRLTGYTDTVVQSPASVVLGALAITAPTALLWATGRGCLRFMGLLAAFIIASAGAGSVLAPWLKRLTNGEGATTQLSG